jgi:hypothetical protein
VINNKKGLPSQNNQGSENKQNHMHDIKKGTSTKANSYFETYEEANQELDQPIPTANMDQERDNRGNQHAVHAKSQHSDYGRSTSQGSNSKPSSGKEAKGSSNQNKGNSSGTKGMRGI